MERPVKVRFAPSPTGYLHIGGARTALFNYLFARKNNGIFILRIEDTDLNRSTYESERVIVRDLNWLGIHWDEGIDIGGENGPYRSTERVGIYKKYVDKLLEEGKAYLCYCTEEELEKEREELLAKGQMPRYLGRCRNLTDDQRKAFEKEGRKPTVRFRVPENQLIVIEDRVRGKVEFNSNDIGDFIIVKSDGIPVYNFAVVVDDHLMGITHIIRGEEHLSNTPRQILIYEALGFEKPEFAHVSLILGKDRTKMSKRHGGTHIEYYRDKGYLPEAIVNFLALLGWSPENNQEIFSLDELVEQFSLDRVAKNPAVFDLDKLNYINNWYIKNSTLDKICELAVPYFIKEGLIGQDYDREWIRKLVSLYKDGLNYIEEIIEKSKIFFGDEVIFENQEARELMNKDFVPSLLKNLKDYLERIQIVDENTLKEMFKNMQKETGVKGKDFFMSVRVAITGQTHGPELVQIMILLGKEKIIKRLNYVLNQI